MYNLQLVPFLSESLFGFPDSGSLGPLFFSLALLLNMDENVFVSENVLLMSTVLT